VATGLEEWMNVSEVVLRAWRRSGTHFAHLQTSDAAYGVWAGWDASSGPESQHWAYHSGITVADFFGSADGVTRVLRYASVRWATVYYECETWRIIRNAAWRQVKAPQHEGRS